MGGAGFLILPFRGILRIYAGTYPFRFRLVRGVLHLVTSGGTRLLRGLRIVSGGALHGGLLACFSFRSRRTNDPAFAVPVAQARLTSCLYTSQATMTQRLDRVGTSNLVRVSRRHIALC